MTANRQLGQLVPLPSVAGQFVWNQATNAWVQVTKAMVGLPLVDNTADSAKPVSAPQQTALDLKAPITNPTFQDGVTAIRQNGAALEFAAIVYSDLGQIPQFIIKRSRGTVASPLPLQTDDRLGAVLFAGVNSSAGAFSNAAGFNVYAAANWTTSSPPTYTTFENTATGAAGRSIVMTFDPNNNLLVGPSRTSTSGARLDVQGAGKFSGPLLIGQYTLTTLPSAATYSGYEIDVTNATGGLKALSLQWFRLANSKYHYNGDLIMSFVKETIRNEILLRFGEQPENKGKLVGALQRSLEQVLEDGEIISSKPLEPEQLSAIPGQAGTPLADVLGEVNAQTIIDNQLLVANLQAEKSKTSTLTEQLIAAQTEIDRLKELIKPVDDFASELPNEVEESQA